MSTFNRKEGHTIAKQLGVPDADKAPKCALYIAEKNICMSQASFDKIKKALGIAGLRGEDEVLERIQELVGAPDEISLLQNSRIKSILGSHVADTEITTRFKPPGPASSRALLSNFDIDGILYHFALAYKGFMPISYGMIDFKDYNSNLKQFTVEDMFKNGFSCAGCVINTDKHTGGGKHWICVFIDTRGSTMTVESFNSSGRPIRPEIETWMNEIEKQLIEYRQKSGGSKGAPLPSTEQVPVYGVQHQKENSECGVYALYYIWSRINGADPHMFFKRVIPDEEIAKFRGFLFREE